MNEQIIQSFTAKVSGRFSVSDVQYLQMALSSVLKDYEISKREQSLVVYDRQLPEELTIYLASRKIEGLSPITIKSYGETLRDALLAMDKPLRDIKTNDIRVYLYQIQQHRGISNRSLDQRRTIINTFFTWLTDNEYITANPCRNIKPIKYEERQRQPLTEEELERLRESCDNLRDKAIVEFFASTACRVTEVVRADISDLDLDHGEIVVLGKGNKHRTVYINVRAQLALRNYLRSRTDNDPALFVGIRRPHKRIDKCGIERIIQRLGEKAGIGRSVFPHLIRHTTATIALERGMQVTQIQKMLGHANLDTTMVYAHVNNTDVRRSHERYVI